MKRINFILLTAIFILSVFNTQGQTALNFNRSMQYQPVYKGTTLTGFKRNTFDNRKSLLQLASITTDNLPGDCPKQFTTREPEGIVLWNYLRQDSETELVEEGEVKRGVLSGPVWGDCVKCFRAGITSQNCSRTNVYQDKLICIYVPVVLGGYGIATKTYLVGERYKKTFTWNEEVDTDYDLCCFWTLLPEVNDAVATVSPGRELVVNSAAEKSALVLGSRLEYTGDDRAEQIPIASIKYNIDGLDITTGKSVLMSSVGEHMVIATIKTKSGGVVKYKVPFSVIKPVTIEEITQQTPNYGELEFKIKIKNNKLDRSSVAWVSASMLNIPGYVVNIQGPEQYDLAKGNSATINVSLRPSEIRRIDPARPEAPVSFDFIVSSPAGKGLIIDRKTVSAQPAAITTPGGIVGTGGPQKVNTISVSTLSGEVVDVKVPNIIRPGDNITGSIVTKSQSSTLQGAVVDVENKKTDVKDKIFSFIVPAGLASIPFLLKDKNGSTIGMTEIPVNASNIPTPSGNNRIPPSQIQMPPQHSPGSFAPMNYCQPGQPLTINGFFDGNAANTNVSINNIPCEIIAESNTGTFAQISGNLPGGQASLTIQEGGVTETMTIQVIRTNLTSNKTVVQKNTKATVTATVSGLENLDLNNNNFKIELANGSPGIIKFNEANTTTISRDINSSNVKNGTFTFTTDITGSATGAYTITSNITSTTCTDCWEQYKTCIAKVEADEKQCYKDCDKNNGGIDCYLACSAAARLQEAECFAQYLGCIRKKLGY